MTGWHQDVCQDGRQDEFREKTFKKKLTKNTNHPVLQDDGPKQQDDHPETSCLTNMPDKMALANYACTIPLTNTAQDQALLIGMVPTCCLVLPS